MQRLSTSLSWKTSQESSSDMNKSEDYQESAEIYIDGLHFDEKMKWSNYTGQQLLEDRFLHSPATHKYK